MHINATSVYVQDLERITQKLTVGDVTDQVKAILKLVTRVR